MTDLTTLPMWMLNTICKHLNLRMISNWFINSDFFKFHVHFWDEHGICIKTSTRKMFGQLVLEIACVCFFVCLFLLYINMVSVFHMYNVVTKQNIKLIKEHTGF